MTFLATRIRQWRASIAFCQNDETPLASLSADIFNWQRHLRLRSSCRFPSSARGPLFAPSPSGKGKQCLT